MSKSVQKRVTAQQGAVRPPASPATTDAARLRAELQADAAATPAPSGELLDKLRAQLTALQRWESEQVVLEEALDKGAKEIRRLTEQVLPALMDEAGIPVLELDTGERVQRAEEVYASISKQNALSAAAWLVAHGHGALVKTQFTIDVDKGDAGTVELVRRQLAKLKLPVPVEERAGVHAQTLKAFVREQLAAAHELPKSITYHVQPIVTVRRAKKKSVLV